MPLNANERLEIKNSLKSNPLMGDIIKLELAQIEDASFILSLRLDSEKNKYLSETSNDLSKQEQFIANSLSSADEFYFIIKDKNTNEGLGTIRLYDMRNDSFCWGSWIIVNHRPSGTALESICLLLDFGFSKLAFQQTHFDARNQNTRAINFYLRIGARIVNSNELDTFFLYTKEEHKIFLEGLKNG
jgi:RimJ/RimL family protein N-acetyltransferase